MSETRDSSPIVEEVRFIEECPHCQTSLSDWMRKARRQHILRCEKRQLEMVEKLLDDEQIAWYAARVRKLIPSAKSSPAMTGFMQIVDDKWVGLSKAWGTERTAWEEAWSRLYSSRWAEYRQMMKERKDKKQAPAERDEQEGNDLHESVAAENRRSVDELGIPDCIETGEQMVDYAAYFENEKPKECPRCGNMNLGVRGDCGFCDDDPVVAHAVVSWDADWHATGPEVVHPEQIPMAGGKVASSKIPPFHLIPTVGLRRLAERFALGIERKGDRAWNAMSNNQEILSDKEFLIERLGHVIDHATKLRDKLTGRGPFVMGDDDAAAIAWGGMYAVCATDVLEWIDTDEGGPG